MHLKHGEISEAGQGERSQTPSGPSGSTHCTPDSRHFVAGPSDCGIASHDATISAATALQQNRIRLDARSELVLMRPNFLPRGSD